MPQTPYYCKSCCNEHQCTCLSDDFGENFIGLYAPRSEIPGTWDIHNFIFWGNDNISRMSITIYILSSRDEYSLSSYLCQCLVLSSFFIFWPFNRGNMISHYLCICNFLFTFDPEHFFMFLIFCIYSSVKFLFTLSISISLSVFSQGWFVGFWEFSLCSCAFYRLQIFSHSVLYVLTLFRVHFEHKFLILCNL